MHKPKSNCCNAWIQVHIGKVEENISDQYYICSKCGRRCDIYDEIANKDEVINTPSTTGAREGRGK